DMGDGNGLISTTDFFMPVVDDAFDFGRIAAANAISDVYAMGGKPLLAVAILGWPIDKLSPAIAQQVLEGGRTICEEAGIPLAGGHSIDSAEPFFGLAVNGTVKLNQLKKNNSAQKGDLIFITKPIGVGILSTAQKRKLIKAEEYELLIKQLTTLNKIGALLSSVDGVNAMTDVTGFGLLGHLIEMAEGGDLSASLNYSSIPIIESAKTYLQQRVVPDATYRNWNSYSSQVKFEAGVNVMEAFNILPDPQTNGGLLIAVDKNSAEKLKAIFMEHGLKDFIQPIGNFIEKQEKTIIVQP
ncbi:MAG: selenide, water dikinase, partial [Chitinophagaceae bacterium]|nr:selenide, water dikinase [Chitinophagaceae bacterium]